MSFVLSSVLPFLLLGLARQVRWGIRHWGKTFQDKPEFVIGPVDFLAFVAVAVGGVLRGDDIAESGLESPDGGAIVTRHMLGYTCFSVLNYLDSQAASP